MTTRTFSTVINHTGNAGFRAWALEISDALDFVGMAKTADTGQIDLATANRPAVNTAAGYEVRYLNDALHGSAPVVIKIEYGTLSSNAARPAMWVTVGTGSNGAGTITGVILARQQFTYTSASTPSTSTPAPTYCCRSGGQFALAWKSGLVNTSGQPGMGFFGISRTIDNAGADTASGVTVYAQVGGNIEVWSTIFGESVFNSGASRQYCMVPYALTGTLTSGNSQAFRHYAAFPLVRPVALGFTVLIGEVPMGSTISLAPAGSTERTYISTGIAGRGACVNGGNAHAFAMIWE
jgi:hypothetical protein